MAPESKKGIFMLVLACCGWRRVWLRLLGLDEAWGLELDEVFMDFGVLLWSLERRQLLFSYHLSLQ